MKLIDKDALVAEIYKWKNHLLDCGFPGQGEYEDGNKQGKLDTCDKILSLVNSLEVKEVDEQKERMSECPYRKVGCTMYEGHVLECTGTCSWVADYPRLKELKAQKGEKI